MTLDVEAKGLKLRYVAVTALDDLRLDLTGGRIYGLLGRNGSGKTSLLSVLAGFRKASGGTVLVDGQPVFENPRVTRRVCLIRETGDTGDKDEKVADALYTGLLRSTAFFDGAAGGGPWSCWPPGSRSAWSSPWWRPCAGAVPPRRPPLAPTRVAAL